MKYYKENAKGNKTEITKSQYYRLVKKYGYGKTTTQYVNNKPIWHSIIVNE